MNDDYHPHLDGPAEPVALSMLIDELREKLAAAEAARDAAVALNVLNHRSRHDHRNLAKNAQDQRDDWMHEAGKLDGLCEMMQGSLEESTKRIAELLDERDVAKAVLAELNLRVNSGYDFNADVDFVTLAVGCVLRGEPLPVRWAAGAGVWRCAPATEKEANDEALPPRT